MAVRGPVRGLWRPKDARWTGELVVGAVASQRPSATSCSRPRVGPGPRPVRSHRVAAVGSLRRVEEASVERLGRIGGQTLPLPPRRMPGHTCHTGHDVGNPPEPRRRGQLDRRSSTGCTLPGAVAVALGDDAVFTETPAVGGGAEACRRRRSIGTGTQDGRPRHPSACCRSAGVEFPGPASPGVGRDGWSQCRGRTSARRGHVEVADRHLRRRVGVAEPPAPLAGRAVVGTPWRLLMIRFEVQ